MYTPHSTEDSKITVKSILSGKYKYAFWIGTIIVGIILPFVFIFIEDEYQYTLGLAGLLILIGILLSEYIWVEAPQQIPLS